MATQPTRSSDSTGGASRGPRLTAEARKSSILAAARQAFIETGDMNGTTIRVIAEHGRISEGVIYRHFESKDQLFFEAVVEPLNQAVDELVEVAKISDQFEPLTVDRQAEMIDRLFSLLVDTLEEMLPLLGLVLFGDPKVAQRFYRESFAVAMDRLAEAWRVVAVRHGFETSSFDVTARAVMGVSLMLALESHHGTSFDRDRALALVAEGAIEGFFTSAQPERDR